MKPYAVALLQAGAVRQAEQLLASVTRNFETATVDTLTLHAHALVRLGDPDGAISLIRQVCGHWRTGGMVPEAQMETVQAILLGSVGVALESPAAYLSATHALQEPWLQLQHALVAGRLDDALHHHDRAPKELGPADRLALYVLLQRAGRFESATRVLNEAVEELRRAAHGGVWAAWLSGDVAPEPAALAWRLFSYDLHPVFVAALAERFPARRDAYLAQAQRSLAVQTPLTLALGLKRPE
jgi:hypothetical protein